MLIYRFNEHSVPDPITANGIYDTTTQTMTFADSESYMKYVASRSNLDRYSNIFVYKKISYKNKFSEKYFFCFNFGILKGAIRKVHMEEFMVIELEAVEWVIHLRTQNMALMKTKRLQA